MSSIKITGIKNFKYNNMIRNKSFYACVILLNFLLENFHSEKKMAKTMKSYNYWNYCCIKYILAADHVRWSLFIGHGYFRA